MIIENLAQILFLISIMSSVSLVILATAAALTQKFYFYPPPHKEGWQHPTLIWLFRGFVYPLIILSFVNFSSLETIWDGIRIAIGFPLLGVGFGLALWITFSMGWQNAFGEKRGLVTTGWFRWSRNPIYMVTWVGLIGWALTVRHWQITLLTAIWGVLYLIAPRLEEPWLEKMYGQRYLEYKVKTPRFF